jgi:hypothetical protein
MKIAQRCTVLALSGQYVVVSLRHGCVVLRLPTLETVLALNPAKSQWATLVCALAGHMLYTATDLELKATDLRSVTAPVESRPGYREDIIGLAATRFELVSLGTRQLTLLDPTTLALLMQIGI